MPTNNRLNGNMKGKPINQRRDSRGSDANNVNVNTSTNLARNHPIKSLMKTDSRETNNNNSSNYTSSTSISRSSSGHQTLDFVTDRVTLQTSISHHNLNITPDEEKQQEKTSIIMTQRQYLRDIPIYYSVRHCTAQHCPPHHHAWLIEGMVFVN